MRPLAIVLVVMLSGCVVNNPYVVEVNGRRVSFADFRSGSVPAGMEVLHFSPGGIKVRGTDPIDVNGLHVIADEESVTIEDQRFTVHPDSEFLVNADGSLQVQLTVPPANLRTAAPKKLEVKEATATGADQ